MNKKKWLIVISVSLVVISCVSFYFYYFLKPLYDIDVLSSLSIDNVKDNKFDLIVSNLDKDIKCGFSNIGNHNIYWNEDSCILKVDNNIDKIYIKKDIFTRSFKIDDLIIGDNLPKKIYLVLNESTSLHPKISLVGSEKKVVYKSLNESIVSVNENKLVGKKIGTTTVRMIVNDNYFKDVEVEVTDLIVKRPKKFDKNKSNLTCKRYSKKDSEKLDKILENRIENVGGYGTRAAVVESMRFLLLDFPYQIEYFFENGRLEGGVHKADGEGRYYHKGLYLDESKFKNLKYTYAGPAIWGCPLMNYEDWGTTFKRGTYKPNGLDCSGFVSWTIVNGGFDIGDRGAGDNLEDNTEINDIGGEKVDTSVELFKSGKVKAGDLLGIWGHIAIVAGIDKEHVYVAESFWTYGGPVINTYTFAEATDEFVQAVLLDNLYKDDGGYTDMW